MKLGRALCSDPELGWIGELGAQRRTSPQCELFTVLTADGCSEAAYFGDEAKLIVSENVWLR